MNAVTGLIIACLALSVYGSPSSQIAGGDDAVYPHPYQAALFVRRGSDNIYFCGGAIITKRYVITAAYCLLSSSSHLLDFYVGVGSTFLNETITYRVDAFIPHAGYSRDAFQFGINNIGLVRLTTDIEFTEYVQPIKLPDSDLKYESYPFIVSGWGKTEKNTAEYPNTLQELVVNGFYSCFTNKPYLLCIYSQKAGMCDLDDGNPVVADGVLIGIVAPRFIECGREYFMDPCTKVFHYKTWIEFHVRSI